MKKLLLFTLCFFCLARLNLYGQFIANAGNDVVICPGSTAILNVSVTGGSGNYFYSWSPAYGLSCTLCQSPVASPTATTITYTVTITDEGDNQTATDDITVYVSPTLTIHASHNTSICLGESTLLSASGAVSYTWMPIMGLSQSFGINITATPTTSTTYTVTGVNNNDCSAKEIVEIHVMECAKICLVGVDSSTNKNIVIWDKYAESIVDSFIIYKETSSGIYSRTGSLNYKEFSTYVDMNSNPQEQANLYKIATVDKQGTISTLSNSHKTIHLTINSGANGVWNLIWNHYEGFEFNSYNIYRGTDPKNMTFLITVSHSLNSYTDLNPPAGKIYYQIEIINSNGCNPSAKKESNYSSSKSNIVNEGNTSISENEALSSSVVNLYPNPTTGEFTIDLNLKHNQEVDLQILNLVGQIVQEKNMELKSGSNKIEMFLNKGIYFAIIKLNEEVITRKIIVQ